MAEEEQHIAAEAARVGSTSHILRYVLGFSLVLTIIAMLEVLWGDWKALRQLVLEENKYRMWTHIWL